MILDLCLFYFVCGVAGIYGAYGYWVVCKTAVRHYKEGMGLMIALSWPLLLAVMASLIVLTLRNS